jgi:protein involved in polysaccharide export with SLBB domain
VLQSIKALNFSLLGFVLVLQCTAQGYTKDKHRYAMPPPEFFQRRNVSSVIIQPGDTIAVTSYYSSELTRTVRVREDGRISLPLLQGIQAAGLTPEQLQQALTSDYAHEFTHPDITVDLVTPANYAAFVTGEVAMPGPKEIHGRMTVAMVLASAQVLQKTGKPKSTFLIRASGTGHYNVYKIDASFPMGSARDIEVIPGDVLFVPKKIIANADDFVDMWVRQLLPATPTIGASVLFTPGDTATVASVSSSK